MAAEYVIGIDLGTTNSVLAYAPIHSDSPEIELLPIPQLVAAQTVDSFPALPSFLYLGTQSDAESESLGLPWSSGRDFAVGRFAAQQSADQPDRTIGAAKSWLCHSKVDRHQAILPWNAADEVPKISPVTASRRYIEHLVDAWHAKFPDTKISEQHVVLTVPASFDASARELTREAALSAGLPDSLVLLEEPQAATYAWLTTAGDAWRKALHAGDRLLVCDIGGGTTDLTLVDAAEANGNLELQRAAVGNHLLVGGDNMDLAIAHFVAGLFAEKNVKLDPWQSVSLWHSCRAAKEVLLAEDGPETHTVSVLGRGRKLIGGTVSVEVPRQAVIDLLVSGFFTDCKLDDKPARNRASGFQEIGLPYEADTAVTKHVAAFLQRELTADAAPPTHVLFNGGVFKSARLRQELLDRLTTWFPQAPPQILSGEQDLDYAVSRGAAYYGWAKQQGGIRIRGGTARSYYVGIETAGLAIPGQPRPLRALCVVPAGMEEGTEVAVPSAEIGLIVGEPAGFRFFSSSCRKDDQPGAQIDRWTEDEIVETDSLETMLTADDNDDEYLPVKFRSRITELGVFELWCVHEASGKEWKLEFSVRDDAEV